MGAMCVSCGLAIGIISEGRVVRLNIMSEETGIPSPDLIECASIRGPPLNGPDCFSPSCWAGRREVMMSLLPGSLKPELGNISKLEPSEEGRLHQPLNSNTPSQHPNLSILEASLASGNGPCLRADD